MMKNKLSVMEKNTEKYITLKIPIKKEKLILIVKTNKNRKETTKTMTYKIKFINDVRFITSSLSNLVENFSEGSHKMKCNDIHDNKYKDCERYLEYKNVKDDLSIVKRSYCNRNYQKKLNEDLKKQVVTTHNFCDTKINKLILMLQKGVNLHDYMDDWEKCTKLSLPEKKSFMVI